MPQRTNPFQQLIHAIHRLIEDGARVTESKMLRDRVTGTEREVDIVIEAPTRLYTLVIGVECRDWARPQDVQWIEQESAKHKDLTDKLVLVSSSGFTAEATQKAEKLGIETLTLAAAEAADWTQVVNKLSQVHISLPRFSLTQLGFQPATASQAITYQSIVHDGNGEPQGNVAEVLWAAVECQMDKPDKRDMVFRALQNRSAFSLGVDAPQSPGSYMVDDAGTRHLVTLVRGVVMVHAESPIPVDLQTATYKGVQVAYGTVPTQGGEGLLTIVEDPNRPFSADLQLPSETPRQKPKRRKRRTDD